MQQSAPSISLSLDDVKNHFDHWRITRDKRRKIPDSLWREVRSLIGRYPVSHVAKALRINQNQISTAIKDNPRVTFVAAYQDCSQDKTVNQPSNILSCERRSEPCLVEIHRPDGCILKITGVLEACLSQIINQFADAS